jgi:hypothetical protein
VHGLNGNAFDTWTANNGTMWLRDLLPVDDVFKKSRVMTFGYNSMLIDSRRVNDCLQDYADELLATIADQRNSAVEKARPLILVCHSLGGLVARQAMVRLKVVRNKFPDWKLRQCGILFLSTPHSGSAQADWSNMSIMLGEVFGLRGHLVKHLQSFNPASVDSA